MKPSAEDKSVTNRLLKAGELLGVNVLDHLIINEEDYFSFLDSGIMAELHASDVWRLVSQESEKVKELQREMHEAKGELNAKTTIAKKLKDVGASETEIRKVTGLTLAKIRGL
jgi:DNA repair protein RadC